MVQSEVPTETTQLRPRNGRNTSLDSESLIRRSWHAMSDLFSPFSPAALASLPKNVPRPLRSTRADAIPQTEENEEGERPTVRDYHAINSVPPQVRVPKKIATPVKVEGKVPLSNERTWISWLEISMLIGTLALALFNASEDPIARYFAYSYAGISVLTVVYAYAIYRRRMAMIRERNPGHFDFIAGPVILSVLLFVAVLANFIVRVRELQRKNVPFPGSKILAFLA